MPDAAGKIPLKLALLILVAATPVLAHHSAAAEYESRLIILKGTVTRVDWMNPHVWIYLDVPDASGVVTKWACEGSSPNGLIHNGWRKGSLKPGDQVTIEAGPAKDQPHVCKVRAAILADGTRLLMGVS